MPGVLTRRQQCNIDHLGFLGVHLKFVSKIIRYTPPLNIFNKYGYSGSHYAQL